VTTLSLGMDRIRKSGQLNGRSRAAAHSEPRHPR